MEQNKNQISTPVFSGTDVIRMIFGKLKLIVCLSLIIAILAGVAAIVLVLPTVEYGTTLNFYLTKKDRTQSLLPLLQSESFAEVLLLDEYGLPEELQGTAEYEEAKAAVVEYKTARERLKQEKVLASRIKVSLTTPKDPKTGETLTSFNAIEQEYSRLVNNYSAAHNLLLVYKEVNADPIVTEEHQEQIKKLEEELELARQEREAYRQSAYAPAQREILEAEEGFVINYRKCSDLKKTADELVEAILADWRSSPEVKSAVSKINASLSFGYATPSTTLDAASSTEDEDDENSINISFLQVSVLVDGNDEELANVIVEKLKEKLPEYAEIHIDLLYDTVSADCTLISPFASAKITNLMSVVISMAIIPVAAFIVTAIIVVLCIIGAEWLRKKEIVNKKAKQ